MKNAAYEDVMSQIARLLSEASLVSLTAEQDGAHDLTPKQRIALKALTRQLHLAHAAQIHAEQAGDAPIDAGYPTARKVFGVKLASR